jgi:hypothetical protein
VTKTVVRFGRATDGAAGQINRLSNTLNIGCSPMTREQPFFRKALNHLSLILGEDFSPIIDRVRRLSIKGDFTIQAEAYFSSFAPFFTLMLQSGCFRKK